MNWLLYYYQYIIYHADLQVFLINPDIRNKPGFLPVSEYIADGPFAVRLHNGCLARCGILSSSANIAADFFLILQILISKCGKQEALLHIDDLQMIHDDGKNG